MRIRNKLILVTTLVVGVALFSTSCAQKTSTLVNASSIEAASINVEKTLIEPIDGTDEYDIKMLAGAILRNDKDIAVAILKSGTVDINTKDNAGQYPLELALVVDNLEMAQLLFENGADQNLMMSSDETIKEKAEREGSEEMKKLFKKYSK